MSGNGRAECPLCGAVIVAAGEAPACNGCGERRGCRSTTCPTCGYHVPEEAPFVGWLRRLFRGRTNGVHGAHETAGDDGEMRLPSLPRGVDAEVVALDPGDVLRLQKVLALGLLPGEPIRLVRKFPSYVIETGLTRFALDRAVASAILVRPRG